MQYPFRLYGREIQIYRFSVTYEEEMPWLDEDGAEESRTQIEYCNTESEAAAVAEAHNGEVTALDSSAYEWLDGIEVADVPDTYAEAVKIYEMGQAAYEAERNKPTPEESIAFIEDAMCEQDMAADNRMAALEDAVCELDAAIHQEGGETL